MARPLAITEPVKAKILEAIREGCYRETAARFGGVTPKTLRAYLARGDDESRAFRAAIIEEETRVEMSLVGAITKLGKGDMKAATWYLSHKFPERWADKSKEIAELLELLREQRAKSDDEGD